MSDDNKTIKLKILKKEEYSAKDELLSLLNKAKESLEEDDYKDTRAIIVLADEDGDIKFLNTGFSSNYEVLGLLAYLTSSM